MAYLYVKPGGTCTTSSGRYTSAKTGSWSTAFTNVNQYYAGIQEVYNNGSVTTGDYILLCDESVFVKLNYDDYFVSNTNHKVVSIDNDDVSVPSPGAQIIFSNSTSSPYAEFELGMVYWYGINFTYNYAIEWVLGTNFYQNSNAVRYESCTFKMSGSPIYQKYYAIQKANTIFSNCVFYLGNSPDSTYQPRFKLRNNYGAGGYTSFQNCTFISYASSTNNLLEFAYATDLIDLNFIGCDFSQCNRPLIPANLWGPSLTINVMGCLLSSNNLINSIKGSVRFPTTYKVLDTSNIYLLEMYYGFGSLKEFSSIYRTQGAEYSDGVLVSKKVVSNNYVTRSSPFFFKLCEFYLDTSAAKTFTVQIAQDNGSSSLTDQQISLDVLYVDDLTSKAHVVTTDKNMLIASSTLPTSSESWIGLTNPTKQYLSVTTSDTGSYGLCSVHLNVYVPDLTFYVCPKVDIT